MNSHLLTGMILLPFLGAVFQAVASSGSSAKWFAFGASVASALLGGVALSQFTPGVAGPQLVDQLPWIGSYAINYELAVDGSNVLLLVLISLVFPVLLASEWERAAGARGLYSLLLILQGSLLGAACAQDLFLLFFFWALSSLPVFFLVGVWGREKKEQAAYRFLAASTLGNSLLFGAFVLIYYSQDPHTFLIRELVAAGGVPSRLVSIAGVEISLATLAFVLVCLGLALRAPIWPLHGWFSKLSDEAPDSVFVAVAAVVVPVAVSLFGRLSNLLFPSVLDACAPWVVGAGLINLILGAIAILSQKRLSGAVAHLTLAHLGLALLGLGSRNPSAMVGVIYHQLGIGLALAVLGLLLGAVARRVAIQEISGKSLGLVGRAPAAAAVMGLSICSFVGFPGLSGFVGQSLIVMGGYDAHPGALVVVGLSSLLVAYSLFGIFRQLFLAQTPESALAELPAEIELSKGERAFLVPLVAMMVLLGFYPKPFLDWIRPTATALVARGAAPTAQSAPAIQAPSTESSPIPSESGAPAQEH
ncbi:MAG: NADH-quinone oxidoreductase subunit M [Oligoflexia bacterium]